MENKIDVAVIGGTGYWGAYIMRAYARHPRCRIVALVDTAADRLAAFQSYGSTSDRYPPRDSIRSAATEVAVPGSYVIE